MIDSIFNVAGIHSNYCNSSWLLVIFHEREKFRSQLLEVPISFKGKFVRSITLLKMN